MEALNTLVSESLARHGFDRPLDYRRLQWSRWFRCESPHSLLLVPSKPGVFALAEEVGAAGQPSTGTAEAGLASEGEQTAASPRTGRRMLAVTQFFEEEDMAFVLDRMMSHQNPMRARLSSGNYFVRFVVIESAGQRRSICAALNQWIANSTEKVTGIGSHFASSLELTPQTEHLADRAQRVHVPLADEKEIVRTHQFAPPRSKEKPNDPLPATTPQLNSGAANKIQCPFPSGF